VDVLRQTWFTSFLEFFGELLDLLCELYVYDVVGVVGHALDEQFVESRFELELVGNFRRGAKMERDDFRWQRFNFTGLGVKGCGE
jgi:hypothetical protein